MGSGADCSVIPQSRPGLPPLASSPMNKEMIISSNGHETRVAILEDDLVAEIFVERERNRGVAGNVYKGRVSKVLPACSRRSSTSVSSATASSTSPTSSARPISSTRRTRRRGGEKAAARGTKARVAVSRPRQARVVDRPVGVPKRRRAQDRPAIERAERIEDLLKEGQEILVQVAKEPLGTKGAR